MTVNDTTAVASDVANSKYFYAANGVKTQGTNSGGGGVDGDGLEYGEFVQATVGTAKAGMTRI